MLADCPALGSAEAATAAITTLRDALHRCGRKPMTVEADESGKGWFEAIGFRTVGRRPGASGGFRYRMGWYAPRLPQEAGYGAH
jgi:hypothetical protein